MSPCSDDEPHHNIGQHSAVSAVGKQQLLESVPHVSLVPMQAGSISSPERRIIAQKEIIAGEERPRYLLINNQPDVGSGNCVCLCRAHIIVCVCVYIDILLLLSISHTDTQHKFYSTCVLYK